MRPDLDVSQALAFITQTPVSVQPQTQPTTPAIHAISLTTPSTTPVTQPTFESTPSSTHPTTIGETASVVEEAVAEVTATIEAAAVSTVVVGTGAGMPDAREVVKEAEPAAEMMVETSGRETETSQPAEAAQTGAAGDLEGVLTTQGVVEEDDREEEAEDAQAVHPTREVDEEVCREEEAGGGQSAEPTDQQKDIGWEEEGVADQADEAAEEGGDVALEDERQEGQVTDLTVDQPGELELNEVEDEDLQMLTL